MTSIICRCSLLGKVPQVPAVYVLALAAAMFFHGTPVPTISRAQSEESLEKKIKSQRRELEKIQKEITSHREKSKELQREEKSLLRRISDLEKEEALSRKLLAGAQEQERLLVERIDSLKVRIAIEEEKLQYQREKLNVRLKQLYMQEPNFRWAMLLGSESLQEMFRRHKFLRLVAERDAKLLEEVREHKRTLEVQQASMTEALVDVAAVRKMREKENGKLQESRKKRLAMLKRIKREKGKHSQAIKELREAQEKLMDLIGTLEEKRLEKEKRRGVAGVDFAKLKGKLIRPVKGRVVKKFGKSKHPTFGTVTFNSGVDIKASRGAPIRAVAGGTIEFVDWIAGYGRCIIVNHGRGYYTLYAHVSEVFIESGQLVSKGDVIAEVGDTGSIEGYICHFEIRKSKKALDPLKWFAR